MTQSAKTVCCVFLLAALTLACATTRIENPEGKQTVYEDAASEGAVSGIGIESQDLIGMTQKMVSDMLASPSLAGRARPPRIVVDARHFRNESSSRINKNLITDTEPVKNSVKN